MQSLIGDMGRLIHTDFSFNCRKKPEKFEILKNVGMVLSGSLWTTLFALL